MQVVRFLSLSLAVQCLVNREVADPFYDNKPLMRLPFTVTGWLALVLLLFTAKLAVAESCKSDPGPYEVDTFLLNPTDAERDRRVPVRVYRPLKVEGALPVVLVSHGLGGTRDNLSYLGNHWASHGYICVHLQHHGSDDAVWRDLPKRDRLKALRQAAMDPEVAIDRARDMPFLLQTLNELNTDKQSKLCGKLDLGRVGVAGHSFGAWSAMVAAGMPVGGKQYGDPRIRCTIPLSPPVKKWARQYEATYSPIVIPVLFMTGTLDKSRINNITAEQRLIPYRHVPGPAKKGAPKYQINFDGADHMTFSGETNAMRLLRKADPKKDPVFHGLILQSTTAFLDCYLLGDQDAKLWLNNGAFVEAIGQHGKVAMDID